MTHYGHAYASRALFVIQLVGPKYICFPCLYLFQVITRDANIQLNSWNTYTVVNLTAGFDGLVVIENGTRTLSVLGEGFQTFDFAAYNNELFIGGHPQLSSVQVQHVFTYVRTKVLVCVPLWRVYDGNPYRADYVYCISSVRCAHSVEM